MRIVKLEKSRKPNGIIVTALLGTAEFAQFFGNLDNLRVFATTTLSEPATATKTGARHSYAKYLLFPVKLRRQFKTDGFDFKKILCGTLRHKDKLYVIYEVPKKLTLISQEETE